MTPPVASLTLHVALAIDLFELLTDVVNAMDQSTPVDLELRLTRAPGADSTGLL